MLASNDSGYFLGFLCHCSTYQKAPWTMCFSLMSIDYEEALPLFPTSLTTMSRCASAGDKWQQWFTPEKFLSWMAAMWRSPLALAKQYVLDMAHRSDASSRRGVLCVSDWTVKLYFLSASHMLRESHTDLSGGKKCYFYYSSDSLVCYRQRRFCSVGLEVWDWDTLCWCGN